MNWIAILSISVTITLTVGGALLKWLLANNREIAEVRRDLERFRAETALNYVRTPEITRIESMINQMRQEIGQQIGSMRGEVSTLSKAVWELVGSNKT